ncbi:hypothetical protein [Streptomyces sp. BF23-19]|uniref:hypothetical protein n=1 Tax=unclassified Streptomyces TaxID=2593676 RepID=UPI0034E54A8F
MTVGAIRDVERPAAPGPHLTAQPESDTLYLFAADPVLHPENLHLALPHTYTAPAGTHAGAPPPDAATAHEPLVFRT